MQAGITDAEAATVPYSAGDVQFRQRHFSAAMAADAAVAAVDDKDHGSAVMHGPLLTATTRPTVAWRTQEAAPS